MGYLQRLDVPFLLLGLEGGGEVRQLAGLDGAAQAEQEVQSRTLGSIPSCLRNALTTPGFISLRCRRVALRSL